MRDSFYCLVSPLEDLATLPRDHWPTGFPQFDPSWTSSDCGRLAFTFPGRVRDFSSGEGPSVDLSVRFDGNGITVERGHVGRSGLFYFRTESLVLVTSNLEDLLSSIECRLNYGAALNYLSFGVALPDYTLVDGVNALPAGHSLTLRPGSLPQRNRTFEVLSETDEMAPAVKHSEIARSVDAAVLESAGDGHPALLLSAGVDSSYIAVLLGDRIGACYTSDFPDSRNRGEFAEAQRLSQLTGQRHAAVPVTMNDARSGLEFILQAAEPKSAWTTIVHNVLCEAIAANGHNRLLSGLGADELFGGYFHYAQSFRRLSKAALRLDPDGSTNPLELVLGSPKWYRNGLFTGIASFFETGALRSALVAPWRDWDRLQTSADFYRTALLRKPGLHLFEAMIAHECERRIPDLLVRGFEAFSRPNGLSSAFPFLDARVMKIAIALGAADRFTIDPVSKRTRNKALWRSVAAGRLPEFVLRRKPTYYDAPIRDWFADPKFLQAICDRLKLRSLLDLGLFSKTWLCAFVDDLQKLTDRDHVPSNKGMLAQAWALATLSAWQDRFLDAR